MNDRETNSEGILLAASVFLFCVFGYVGCSTPAPVPRPSIPTPPAQPTAVSERWTVAKSLTALAAPGMSLTVASNAPARVIAQAPYQGRAQLSLAWNRSPSINVAGYRLYFGTTSGSYTNSANVGDTTVATVINLNEGERYYFTASAYTADGVESETSNEAFGDTGFYVNIRTANWAVETYGREGVINQIQRSTDLTTWTTVKEFTGRAGVLTNVIEPNNVSAYYRVRVKP